MGELRGNHFHGGLDIRTGYRTGLPVHASADGYISYIQISSHGYGYMLHAKHATGLVTVYAHLERFREDLQVVAQDQQRSRDAFEVVHYPAAGVYKVARGEVIGWSGNTGSSGGPHLHYEVRDTNDVVLNPLHFGFKEVQDRLAPYMSSLTVRTFGLNSRVNSVFGLEKVPIKYVGKNTYVATPLKLRGTVGFQILARDRINNGTQHTGISCIELRVDGKEVYSVNLERFQFRQTGHINVHIDYELLRQTGDRYQKVYADDGNQVGNTSGALERGYLTVNEPGQHTYEIICYDAYGNTCRLKGSYTLDDSPLFVTAKAAGASDVSFKVCENILKITASGPLAHTDSLGVWVQGQFLALAPRFYMGSKNVYLYDLRLGVPDSLGSVICRKKTNLIGSIPSGQVCRASSNGWGICFRYTSLFDTCYLNVQGKPDQRDFEFGNPDQPLFTHIDVRAKLLQPLGPKEAYYLVAGGRLKWLKTHQVQDSLWFETKYFGRFKVLKDSTPPLARVVQANSSGFKVIIKDNLSGIRDFHVYLNNKPLALEYDHKRDLVWVTAQELDIAGKGALDFVVRDNCGNEKRVKAAIL